MKRDEGAFFGKYPRRIGEGMGLGARGLEYIYQGVFISLMVIFPLSMNPAKCASLPQEAFIQIVYQDGLLSVDLQNAPASEVFKELARRTPYEFIVPEELLVHRVTLKYSGVDMDEAIRRVMSSTGVDNYALVYSPREAKPYEGPLYRVKVVLLGGDFRVGNEASGQQASFEKASEPSEEVAIRPDSFPVVREEPVPSEKPLSSEVSVELVPRVGDSTLEEVPTPVELSSESEDFPVYRKLEDAQMPTELQESSPPSKLKVHPRHLHPASRVPPRIIPALKSISTKFLDTGRMFAIIGQRKALISYLCMVVRAVIGKANHPRGWNNFKEGDVRRGEGTFPGGWPDNISQG